MTTHADAQVVLWAKDVYGNELLYPDSPLARLFCEVAGTKTMSRNTLAAVESFGYPVVIRGRREDSTWQSSESASRSK